MVRYPDARLGDGLGNVSSTWGWPRRSTSCSCSPRRAAAVPGRCCCAPPKPSSRAGAEPMSRCRSAPPMTRPGGSTAGTASIIAGDSSCSTATCPGDGAIAPARRPPAPQSTPACHAPGRAA